MVRTNLTIILLLLVSTIVAQQDPVMIRIDGKDVLRSEFEYFYNKNKSGSDLEKKTLDKYVNLFVDFKLKVRAAEDAGLDTVALFKKELEEYRLQLIKSYLTDREVTEKEARYLYDKMKDNHRAGQVHVAHIFKYLPQNVTSITLRETEMQIDSVYKFLQKNNTDMAFKNCVDKFSDEKQTFWMSWLQMPIEFEDTVFSLKVGEISRPFYTPQGIHIVKVLGRKEIPSFETVKDEIIRRRTHHYNIDKGTRAFVEKLKKEYRYTPDKFSIDELMTQGSTVRTLFTLNGKKYTGKEFSHFAMTYPAGVRKQLEGFIMKSVLDYENSRLEQKYPNLCYQVLEYRDNLLLDRITEQEIERRALTDEYGLQAYFDKHRSNYQWKEPRYKGIVLHCTTKRIAKQARKFLKHLPENEWKDAIRLTFNAGSQPQIQLEQGVFTMGDNIYVDDLVFKKEDATPVMSFPFTAVLGKKVKGPEDYQEVRKVLIADYHNYLEGQWMNRLRTNAKVEINQEVLKTVNNH